jgi:hypothetical protein
MGKKPMDPEFASKTAEKIDMGLDTAEITKWRAEAWKTAKQNLGQ